MQIGMVGLGCMGGNIVHRLIQHGHQAVVHDRDSNAMQTLTAEGATGAAGVDALVQKLQAPRAIWVMLPAGEITETAARDLSNRLQPGDIIIDGGNTFWRDDIRRARALRERGLHDVDVGRSALAQDPCLEGYSGYVEDSGEGRWTIMAAIEQAVSADVLSAALFARFRSRQGHTFAEKILSAMRNGFGGHIEPDTQHKVGQP